MRTVPIRCPWFGGGYSVYEEVEDTVLYDALTGPLFYVVYKDMPGPTELARFDNEADAMHYVRIHKMTGA